MSSPLVALIGTAFLVTAVSALPLLGSLTADASASSAAEAKPSTSSGFNFGGNLFQAGNTLTNMQKSKMESSTETEQTAMSMTSQNSALLNLGAIAPALSQLSNTISQTKTETKQSLENAEVTMMQQGINIYESGLRDGIKAGKVMAEEGLKAGAQAGAEGTGQAVADAAAEVASSVPGGASLSAVASAGSDASAAASGADEVMANAGSAVSASAPGDLAASMSSAANAGASVGV